MLFFSAALYMARQWLDNDGLNQETGKHMVAGTTDKSSVSNSGVKEGTHFVTSSMTVPTSDHRSEQEFPS